MHAADGLARTAEGGAIRRLCARGVGRTARAVAVAGAAVGAATKGGAGRTADQVLALHAAADVRVVAVLPGGATDNGVGATQLLAGVAADVVLGLVIQAVGAARPIAVRHARVTYMQESRDSVS